jgi:hypothetical protein
MRDGGHIAQEDLALYAMRVCSAEDAAAVRAHVRECAACKDELARVSDELAVVAMSVEQQSLPEGARERFMGKIADAPVSRLLVKGEGKTVRRVKVWVPWAMAAAMALLAVGLAMANRSLQRELRWEERESAELRKANAHAQEVQDVLTAADAQHVVLTAGKAKPAPSARAVYLASKGALILQASNLEQLPEKKAYELWVIPMSGKAPIPAGLFWPDAKGSASLVLPKLPVGVEAKAFGVTIEDDEGSPWPTSPILLAGGV